jgi:cytoskeletal protein RodZ
MFVIGIREEEDHEVVVQNIEPVEAQATSPQLALVNPPPRAVAAPKKIVTPKRPSLPRHSFLQRHAAFAAAFILPAAVIIFYLSLFGSPSTSGQLQDSRTSQATVSATSLPQQPTPVTQAAQSPVSTGEVASALPTSTPQTARAVSANTERPRADHKPARHQPARVHKPSAPEPDPEVTIRHFPIE